MRKRERKHAARGERTVERKRDRGGVAVRGGAEHARELPPARAQYLLVLQPCERRAREEPRARLARVCR